MMTSPYHQLVMARRLTGVELRERTPGQKGERPRSAAAPASGGACAISLGPIPIRIHDEHRVVVRPESPLDQRKVRKGSGVAWRWITALGGLAAVRLSAEMRRNRRFGLARIWQTVRQDGIICAGRNQGAASSAANGDLPGGKLKLPTRNAPRVFLLPWLFAGLRLSISIVAEQPQFFVNPVVDKRIKELPAEPLHWEIENFDGLAQAQAADSGIAGQTEDVVHRIRLAPGHHLGPGVVTIAADGQPRLRPVHPDAAHQAEEYGRALPPPRVSCRAAAASSPAVRRRSRRHGSAGSSVRRSAR
jgi:hypothetical protein